MQSIYWDKFILQYDHFAIENISSTGGSTTSTTGWRAGSTAAGGRANILRSLEPNEVPKHPSTFSKVQISEHSSSIFKKKQIETQNSSKFQPFCYLLIPFVIFCLVGAFVDFNLKKPQSVLHMAVTMDLALETSELLGWFVWPIYTIWQFEMNQF